MKNAKWDGFMTQVVIGTTIRPSHFAHGSGKFGRERAVPGKRSVNLLNGTIYLGKQLLSQQLGRSILSMKVERHGRKWDCPLL